MADQQLNITLNAIDNTKKALTDLQNNLRGIDKQTKEVTTSFFTFSNVLKTFITAEVIRGTFTILSSFQDMKVALNQVTGSAQQGGRAFDFLNKFSETSRFNIKDLSNAFIALYRSGINPTEELLKTFTDTASATRQPLETLNALILLFTKGTEGGMGLLQFRRLEGELVPVFKILRQQFGLSKDSVEEYLKSVTGTKYVLDLLKEGLRTTFGGTEAANAKNLSTTFDDVKNAGEKLLASLGDSGLNKVLAETFILLKDIIDLVKNSDLVKFLGLLGTGLGYISDAIGKGVKAYKEARKGYQEAIGMGGTAKVPPDAPVTPKPNTMIEEVFSQLNVASTAFQIQWEDINKIIAKGTVDAIKSVSVGIAESIVLGKKLQDTFREIAQKILIKILSNLIEEQLIKLALIALDQLKLVIAKLQTQEIIKQNALLAQRQAMSGDSGGSGFLGSLLNIGMSLFSGGASGGGFNPDIGGIPDTYVGMAEGGSINAGMPITVGERGREVFVPKTDGTIIPNQDLGGGTNITFNIQANDVRGIRELLIDNRATIINLVNQGANQKGKSNVV
jgi:hypothetical protein